MVRLRLWGMRLGDRNGSKSTSNKVDELDVVRPLGTSPDTPCHMIGPYNRHSGYLFPHASKLNGAKAALPHQRYPGVLLAVPPSFLGSSSFCFLRS